MIALHHRIETSLNRARGLHDLAAWISNARDFTSRVERCAAHSAEAERTLQGVPLHLADWEEHHQNGLDYLNLVIAELLHDVGCEVDADYAAQQASRQADSAG